jgi:hypothetical protein
MADLHAAGYVLSCLHVQGELFAEINGGGLPIQQQKQIELEIRKEMMNPSGRDPQ